jgi:hypothetical protein
MEVSLGDYEYYKPILHTYKDWSKHSLDGVSLEVTER